MANSSAKKIAKDNTGQLRFLQQGFLAVHLTYWIFRFLLGYSTVERFHSIAYVLSSVASFFVYGQLHSMAQPQLDPKTGALLNAGVDLQGPGLIQYMLDMVYISWIVLLGSAWLSDYFWYLFLAIPVYAVYKLWGYIAPMLLGRGGASSGDSGAAGKSRRAEKRETQQQGKFAR